MVSGTREKRLAAAFVTLADTLVAGYDIVELLQTLVDTCADLLDASAAGIILADPSGELEVIASTSEESRLVDVIQSDSGFGPSMQCFLTGRPVSVADIALLDGDWSDFSRESLAQGFRSAHVVPLRLRGRIIGTLTLLRTQVGFLTSEDMSVAQGLADVATIGILHERAVRESDLAQLQLQHALNSRVVIEQAKGVVAQVRSVDMAAAFQILRAYARSHNLGLREVAEQVVSQKLTL
ncbi:GAF domain-containing protein [Glaciihabitans tibetensis]|uniref:GAF domain-containing protein n=1 Tax=Glaciihabitans tibetensis TaxID=1266600 RepID=A0A2T0VK41_9MICO|nr:GAF and ANTAR domain-containing protein [Glaciihabitans tibetensis]PRY70553.1 GAF domain-containing protein [Glaciihabitans tibetensis]